MKTKEKADNCCLKEKYYEKTALVYHILQIFNTRNFTVWITNFLLAIFKYQSD